VDLFRTYGGRPFTDAQAVICYVLYFILAIVLSTLLFKYFEQPMLKLREKDFSFRKKTVPQPSSQG
jgi:peptidoglycan/LPS O-acetylase OafA/YrhL